VKPITSHRARLTGSVICAVLALTLPALAAERSASGAVTARITRTTTKIAPGLTLTRIVDKRTPRRIFVLTVNISTPLTMDVALAGLRMPTLARTSDIAKRDHAIAAVNGDFGSRSGGPTHPFEQDGLLIRSADVPGIMFAVSKDEQNVIFAQPKQRFSVTDPSGQTWPIDRWNNGPPGVGEIAASTPVGGSLSPPPPATCSARLVPDGSLAPTADAGGFQQLFTVQEQGCFESSLPTDGGVVLSALPGTDEALQLLSLQPGTVVTLQWSLGFTNVWDAIGGVPLLVSNGRNVAGSCTGSVCSRNPRTGVGVTANGKILLVVVDGRQPKWSVGATMLEFAKIFRNLGATFALNLDGGGSSTLVVKGKVVNRPSSGFERGITNALLVLPGPDPKEPG
jgi:exopolysaccharide biosynthesis protein